MALDATVPVLVSLLLLALGVAVAATTNHLVAHPPRRHPRPTRSLRWEARPRLRCPRVVLIDEVGRTGAGPWIARAS